MLEAIFLQGMNIITVHGLTQWDYGQKLKITCDGLPDKFQVHFANAGDTVAYVVEATTTDGVAIANIPNIVLQQSSTVTAWLYIDTGTDGETVKTVKMPIVARTKPSDYAYTETEVLNYETAVAKMEEETAKVAGIIEKAQAAADIAVEAAGNLVNIEPRVANNETQIENHSVQIENHSVQIANNDQRIARNDKRIRNLEQYIDPTPYETDADVAYTKDVPADALPFASVDMVGGMTYRVNTGTEESPEYELRSAPVTAVESVGANLYSPNVNDWGFTGTYCYLKLPPYETYTITVKKTAYSGTGAYLGLCVNPFNISEGYAWSVASGEVRQKTLTASIYKYLVIYTGSSSVAGLETILSGFEVQVNKGETALPYTPYVKHTLPIPAEVQALDGYGLGVSDTVYNYIDWEKKQFVKRVEKIVFDGTEENWQIYTYTDVNQLYLTVDPLPISAQTGHIFTVCSHYKDIALSDRAGNFETCYSASSSICFNTQEFTTIEEWTAYLAEQYAAGTPVTVYYTIGEPVITDISDILPADNYIGVEGNGTLTFVNEYGYAVPSEITYMLKGGDDA